jgi:hypothetical protein
MRGKSLHAHHMIIRISDSPSSKSTHFAWFHLFKGMLFVRIRGFCSRLFRQPMYVSMTEFQRALSLSSATDTLMFGTLTIGKYSLSEAGVFYAIIYFNYLQCH